MITQKHEGAGVANDAKNLTPNPFPSGKGDRTRAGCVGLLHGVSVRLTQSIGR
jgi:hypothetical protein